MINMEDWGPGYSPAELDTAQEKFGLRFPPDLIEVLREGRPPSGWDWITNERAIRQMLEWPLHGFLFDVEKDSVWWPEWGERPTTEAERAEVVKSVISRAPKLIPIRSHRYLPEEPGESGNPVFSVYQTDIIYYGANLENYFELERSYDDSARLGENIRHIRFWSDAVENTYDPACTWSPG